MPANQTPKQKGRIVMRIDKSAKSPGNTSLDYRGLFVGEFAPGSEKSSLNDPGDLKTIKRKADLEKVIKDMKPKIEFQVDNIVSDQEDAAIDVNLQFKSMGDFHPDAIVKKIPELQQILEIRKLLKSLKVKMIQDRKFKKLLDEILKSGQLHELKDKLATLADSSESKQ